MLEYSLHENPLTNRPDDYVAQTHVRKIYDKEEFIALMMIRHTMMTHTDVIAVFDNIEETAGYIAGNGDGINLPLFNTGHAISGVFNSIMDSYDPKRHRLHLTINKGTVFRNAEKNVKLTKVNVSSPQPQILEVKDSVTGKVDEVLTAGGAIELFGINIKIAGKNALCGLYFVDENDKEIQAVTIVQNKPSTLIALIPVLGPGYYRVKLVTQFAPGRDLKEPRTTVYEKTLKVS
jgi:hypothetical protein